MSVLTKSLLTILLLAILSFGMYNLSEVPKSEGGPEVKRDLSQLVLTDMNTDIIEIVDSTKVVYFFWGSYCSKSSNLLDRLDVLACNSPIPIVCVSKESIGDICNYTDHYGYNCLKFARIKQGSACSGIGILPDAYIKDQDNYRHVSAGNMDEIFRGI